MNEKNQPLLLSLYNDQCRIFSTVTGLSACSECFYIYFLCAFRKWNSTTLLKLDESLINANQIINRFFSFFATIYRMSASCPFNNSPAAWFLSGVLPINANYCIWLWKSEFLKSSEKVAKLETIRMIIMIIIAIHLHC